MSVHAACSCAADAIWDPARIWRLLQETASDATTRLDAALDRAFWERVAPTYHDHCLARRVPAVVERLLAWIRPGESVLEVGAGTGGFTLPVAQRAGRVSALDYAPAMLRALAENLARAGLENVTLMEADFETAPLPRHDVVLAANALYRVRDGRATLERLLAAARRRLLVVWSVGRAQPWERLARDLVAPGRYRPGADYIHLLGLLYDLGCDADVVVVDAATERVYPDADSALAALACWPDPTPEELERCRALLLRLFEPLPGGGYRATVRERVALLRCEVGR